MTEFSFMPGKSQAPDALVGFSGGREAEAVSDLQSFLPDTPKFPPVSAPPAAPPENQSLNWSDEFQETPDFASAPVSPGTQRAFRSARTEAQNLEQGLRRYGFGRNVDEVMAEQESGGMWNVIEPVFDLLTIGSLTVNGFADELLDTGNLGLALRQGAIEFYEALPGLTHTEARRLTGSDLLLEHTDVFSDSAAGRWGAMGLGLIMDVILDPLTTPFLGLKVLNKGVGIARTGERMGGLAFGLGTKPMLNVGGQAIADGIRNNGGVAGATNILARNQYPGAQKFGESFLPDFEYKQAVLNAPDEATKKRLQASYDSMREGRVKLVAQYNEGMIDLRDVAKKLKYGLSQEEDLFIGLWLDQEPEKLEQAIISAAHHFSTNTKNTVTFEMAADRLKHKLKVFRDEYKKLEFVEKDAGLWEKGRPFYSPGRSPTTARSERFWRNFDDVDSKDQLADEQLKILEQMGWTRPVAPAQPKGVREAIDKKATFAHEKDMTVQQRMAMSLPTELNSSLAFVQSGKR